MHDNNGLIHWKECNHGPEGEKEAQILEKVKPFPDAYSWKTMWTQFFGTPAYSE